MSSKSIQVRQRFNSESDIAVREPNALEVQTAPTYTLAPDEIVQGTENLDRDDFQQPHLTLVQLTHADIPDSNLHVGEWYNDLTGEFHPDLTAVLLSEIKGRAAFPRKFARDSELLCGSDDALTPRGEFIGVTITDDLLNITHQIDSEGCAVCPFSHFGPNGEGPLCGKQYQYSMLDVDGIPFVLRAWRAGSQAAKQLNSVAKLLGRRKMIRISSREIVSDTGKYFVPVFSTDGYTTPQLRQYAMEITRTFGNITVRSEAPKSSSNGHGAAEQETPLDPPEEELAEPF